MIFRVGRVSWTRRYRCGGSRRGSRRVVGPASDNGIGDRKCAVGPASRERGHHGAGAGVLGITFNVTGYVIADPWLRLLAAAVVALTVVMLDRALYHSDWFVQGVFRLPAGNGERGDPWAGTRRFFRIAIRLTISLGLAWVIAVFQELAVFSDAISEKTKRDHVDPAPLSAGLLGLRKLNTAKLARSFNHGLLNRESFRRRAPDITM
jgi:hypothetical protein